MGIFNAISGTPTSANPHGSTTVLWCGCSSRAVFTTGDEFQLPASREENHRVPEHNLKPSSIFFFLLYMSRAGKCFLWRLRSTFFFLAFTCQIWVILSFLYSLFSVMFRWVLRMWSESARVYPILWLTTQCYLNHPGVLSSTRGMLQQMRNVGIWIWPESQPYLSFFFNCRAPIYVQCL